MNIRAFTSDFPTSPSPKSAAGLLKRPANPLRLSPLAALASRSAFAVALPVVGHATGGALDGATEDQPRGRFA